VRLTEPITLGLCFVQFRWILAYYLCLHELMTGAIRKRRVSGPKGLQFYYSNPQFEQILRPIPLLIKIMVFFMLRFVHFQSLYI